MSEATRNKPTKSSAVESEPNSKEDLHNPERYDATVVLLFSVWIGVIAGTAELIFLGILKITSSAVPGAAGPSLGWQSGHLWLSRHVVWMTPVATVCQLAVVGFAVLAVSRIRRSGITVTQIVAPLTFVAVASLLSVYQRLYDVAVIFLAAGLAVQMGRLAKTRASEFAGVVRKSAPWMAAVLLALTIGTNAAFFATDRFSIMRLPEPSLHRPNILLLILDTVRATNTSVNGYERETTPNLEQLAATGVAFDRAIATSPWTLPSHVSIMTGRLPCEVNASFLTPYRGECPTIAEVLSQEGYATAGFVSNVMYCDRNSGLDRGFQHYEDYPISVAELIMSTGLGRRLVHSQSVRRLVGYYDILGRKSAETVSRDFLRWLDHRPADRPFFAFLNYNDAHDPYLPPQPFDKKFGGRLERRTDLYTYQMRRAPRTNRPGMTDNEIQAEIDAYDGAIAYVDQQIGVVLNDLRSRNMLDNTIVVAVGDHGEQFGEHGLHEHGNSVFMPVLHVPMIVSYGDNTPAGTRVADPVSLQNIPTTVLSMAGGGVDGSFSGTSLEHLWHTPSETADSVGNDLVFSEFTEIRESGKAKSLVTGRYHYLVGWGEVPVKDRRTGEPMLRAMRYESLFDFEADPDEMNNFVRLDQTENLIGEFANLVVEMRGLMAPHLLADTSVWKVIPPWAPERQILPRASARQD